VDEVVADPVGERQMFAAKFYDDKAVFQREWDVLKKVGKKVGTDPHLVALIAIIKDDAKNAWHPYSVIIMDYCEITLEEFWDQSRAQRTPMDARAVLKNILDGLDYCHKQGIVHTDLKPKNIMRYRPYVTQDTWVIVDFDSAVAIGEKFACDERKCHYVCPELARARKLGKKLTAAPSVDMWGMGRILYFMATSFPFWPADKTDEAIITQLAAGQFTLRRDLFDKPTFRVLTELLQVDPEKRWRLDRLKACRLYRIDGSRRALSLRAHSIRKNSRKRMLKC
jgi:serine/threonine protein kinase